MREKRGRHVPMQAPNPTPAQSVPPARPTSVRSDDSWCTPTPSYPMQVTGLMRAWCMLREEDPVATLPKRRTVAQLACGLCNLALRDLDLGSHMLDNLLRGGLFPARLSPAAAARWWVLTWKDAAEVGRASITALLRGKCDLQRQVKELLRLRAEVKRLHAGGGGGSGHPSLGGQRVCVWGGLWCMH